MIDTSSLPADAAERKVWIQEQEDRLAALTRSSLRRIVVGSFERFLGSLTAAGDLSTLDDIPSAWLTVVYDDIAPKVEEVYLAGSATAWVGMPNEPTVDFARQWEAVTNENAVSYMADATNRLAGVGDTTWGMVKSKTESALAQGLSNEDLKAQIESVTKFSEFRADTIARTETNMAYVQGDMAGARALGSSGPVVKVWRSTDDARTREDHADAEGQTVAMSEMFTVGGEPMDSPLDPSASAGNVVNCRCYAEFLYPGDEAPDGSIVEAPEAPVPEPLTVEPVPVEGAVAAEMGSPRTPAFARVDAAADKFGVSRAQVSSFMLDGPKVAAGIRAEAASSAAESFAFLDRFEGLQLLKPGKVGTRGGEYDFLERLSSDERKRLSSGGWYTDRASAGIDVVFDQAVRVGAIAGDASIDDFVDTWLHHTRVIDASKSVRAGRLPGEGRFGGFDPVELAPNAAAQGIDVTKIIGKDAWDQAGYLAQQSLEGHADEAFDALGADRLTGTAPWRMSFETWRTEVGDLEYNLANGLDTAATAARLEELVPRLLDSGQDYEDLYAEIIEVAKVAKVDVASWAVIPWA